MPGRPFIFPPLSRFVALIVVATGMLAGGCSHYQLGIGGTPTFHTLYVEPAANKTTLPQAREIVSTRIREAFLRDGRVALANSAEEADATLTVTIMDYHRDVAAVREGDTGLARKFDLTLGDHPLLRRIWRAAYIIPPAATLGRSAFQSSSC